MKKEKLKKKQAQTLKHSSNTQLGRKVSGEKGGKKGGKGKKEKTSNTAVTRASWTQN